MKKVLLSGILVATFIGGVQYNAQVVKSDDNRTIYIKYSTSSAKCSYVIGMAPNI